MKSAAAIAAIVVASALLGACGHSAAPGSVSGTATQQYGAGVTLALQLENQSEQARLTGASPGGPPVAGEDCASGTFDGAGDIVVTWTCESLAGKRLVLRARQRTSGGQAACFRLDPKATTVPAGVVGSRPAPGNC